MFCVIFNGRLLKQPTEISSPRGSPGATLIACDASNARAVTGQEYHCLLSICLILHRHFHAGFLCESEIFSSSTTTQSKTPIFSPLCKIFYPSTNKRMQIANFLSFLTRISFFFISMKIGMFFSFTTKRNLCPFYTQFFKNISNYFSKRKKPRTYNKILSSPSSSLCQWKCGDNPCPQTKGLYYRH